MSTNRTVNGTCEREKPREIGSSMSPHEALNILDIICTAFFTIELIVRFIFAPDKLRFVISAMNIIDLLALVPLYMQLVFNYGSILFCYQDERLMVEIMFILRIVRMFRIFHLVKHYQALKILVYALKASVQELLMLAIFLIIGTLIFATMIYYAERRGEGGAGDTFRTIPIGFWWAIMTMTTVGYGDVYPTSPVGYIVGAACGVSGVLMIALTIPVISNNFTLFYTHVRSRKSDKPRDFDNSDENLAITPEVVESISKRNDYARRMSNGSVITETLMNGKTVLKDIGKRAKYVPMAKFSEANSMTDIVVNRNDSSDVGLTRTVSVNAQSDDGIAYAGETML